MWDSFRYFTLGSFSYCPVTLSLNYSCGRLKKKSLDCMLRVPNVYIPHTEPKTSCEWLFEKSSKQTLHILNSSSDFRITAIICNIFGMFLPFAFIYNGGTWAWLLVWCITLSFFKLFYFSLFYSFFHEFYFDSEEFTSTLICDLHFLVCSLMLIRVKVTAPQLIWLLQMMTEVWVVAEQQNIEQNSPLHYLLQHFMTAMKLFVLTALPHFSLVSGTQLLKILHLRRSSYWMELCLWQQTWTQPAAFYMMLNTLCWRLQGHLQVLRLFQGAADAKDKPTVHN